MKIKYKINKLGLLAVAMFNLQPTSVHAQGTTAFTYQGQLHDNNTNANGGYTMIFKLYDGLSAGNQIGSAITNNPTLANGLFSVNLDFGNAFTGAARWLDITITNGGVTQTLSPRVQVLPAPYAQFAAIAATVTNGAITSAQLSAGAVSAVNLAVGSVSASKIAAAQVVKSLNGLTDNVTLSAGTNVNLVANGNALQIFATVPTIVVFTNSGTFVVPTNVTRVMVEMWGGGGGGGTGGCDSSPNCYLGGGGGAGGYAWNVFSVTGGIPNGFYTVAVGQGGVADSAGGTSSFGSLISAGGGAPGAGGNNYAIFNGSYLYNGGPGGTNSGSLAGNLTSGGDGNSNQNTYPYRGAGGVAWRGGGPYGNGPGAGGYGIFELEPTTDAIGGNGLVIISY